MSNSVKVFWVEPSGNVEIELIENGVEVKRRFTEAEGEAITGGNQVEWRSSAPLYRLPDGSEVPSRDLPPGALWHADYLADIPEMVGPDGLALVVKLPNGNTWNIDSRANNCTLKDDTVHKCWCRHGDPRTGNIHVDKVGNTCAAGAGSIVSGNYHGFLHNGHLVLC